MSYWDSKTQQIISYKPKKSKHYRGWYEIDCGCSGGLQWGGDTPRECKDCDGLGMLFWHKKSGVLALYPGGSLKGRDKTLVV